jgi:hypothetical protein
MISNSSNRRAAPGRHLAPVGTANPGAAGRWIWLGLAGGLGLWLGLGTRLPQPSARLPENRNERSGSVSDRIRSGSTGAGVRRSLSRPQARLNRAPEMDVPAKLAGLKAVADIDPLAGSPNRCCSRPVATDLLWRSRGRRDSRIQLSAKKRCKECFGARLSAMRQRPPSCSIRHGFRPTIGRDYWIGWAPSKASLKGTDFLVLVLGIDQLKTRER